MFDNLTHMADDFFDSQRQPAQAFAQWIIRLIEKPVRLLARPKSDRPENYEVVEQAPPGLYD